MADYQLAEPGVTRTSDGLHITFDMIEWAEYVAWYKAGGVADPLPPPPPPPPPTQAEIQARMTDAVQNYLDQTARTHGYDGILSACSYATDSHPPFAAEGKACVDWRGQVWATCYALLTQVDAGTIPIPTLDELIAQLPKMEWPT